MSSSTRRSLDPVDAIIFDLFAEVLARPPEEAERAEWFARLMRGVPLRELRAWLDARATPATSAPVDADAPVGAGAPVDAVAVDPFGNNVAAIRASGLFDETWYRHRYPDVAAAGADPLRHYAEFGMREDRAPNPWFDPAWYRTSNALAHDANPLFHYLAEGEAKGSRPSARFDPTWYRAVYDLASKRSPLADFLRRRRSRTVAPSPGMWAALGLAEPKLDDVNDDVFLSIGDEPADCVVLRDEAVFDENYYALHSGDVLAAGTDLLRHYCEFGWRERRQPNFYFDSVWYAATNPEVTRLGVNPLSHYLLVGEPEGRRPIVFFDPVWYRETYGVPEEVSALAHFLAHRREGAVSPNEFFDPVWYSQHKGERLRPGRDPFARFLVTGLTEDVSPGPNFDLPAYRKRAMGRVSRHFRHLLDPAKDNPLAHYLLTTYR